MAKVLSNEHHEAATEAQILRLCHLEVASNLAKHARGLMTQVEGDLFVACGRSSPARQAAVDVLNGLYKLREALDTEIGDAHRAITS